MQAELYKWLLDSNENTAAKFFAECRMDIVYIDSLFELYGGDNMIVLVDCNIAVPAKYFFKLQSDFFNQVHIIETQLQEVAIAMNFKVRNIYWVPKVETENNESMKISIVIRQEIFDEITINSISWSGKLEEQNFLNRLFHLSKLPSFDGRYDNAYDDIYKHRVMNHDWEDDWIFTDRRFNLLHCDEEVILKFFSLTLNPVVRDEQEAVKQLLEIYNRHLLPVGIEFYEKSSVGGKPIYSHREIDSTTITSTTSGTKIRKLALVIGCSEYEFVGSLANPLNDAIAMKEKLKELDFDVMSSDNPTLKEMKIAIDDFGTELDKYDVGLFYFAGHGVQVKGLNYLIPVDANLKNERTVEYDCVRVDRVLSHLEEAKTITNLLILDACRNNPFERSWGRDLSQRGLAVMDAPKGSLIAYSTSPGKTASDGSGTNGLYTGILVSEIKSVNTTVTQLFQRVRKSVMEKSKNEQIPWESTSLTADFYFNLHQF